MEFVSCGGARTLASCRHICVTVTARHSCNRQEWRIDGLARGGRGRDQGRGGRGPARGRGGRPPARRVHNQSPEDDQADDYGLSSRFVSRTAPQRRPYGSAGRRTSTAPPPPPPQRPSADSQDPFGNLQTWIQTQHSEGIVIRRETWEKLLGHVRTAAQASGALELLLRDAKVRDSSSWDWATHGYGQTAFQLVQVAAEAGAPEVAERLLKHREELHLTLNKDLLPTLIRKVASATAETESADGSDVGACVEVVQRLYEQEVSLRGANSPEAAYELSRMLRRAGDVRGIKSLHAQMLREGLAVRDRLLEDIERWLAKRGVRV